MEPRAVAGGRGEFFYPICRNTPWAARPLGLKVLRWPCKENLDNSISISTCLCARLDILRRRRCVAARDCVFRQPALLAMSEIATAGPHCACGICEFETGWA